jgi:hypothetical protein
MISFSLAESPPHGVNSDHDIYVGVTDGASFTGFGRQDNQEWRGSVFNGEEGGSFGVPQIIFLNAGFDATFNGTVATDGVSTTVNGSFGSGAGEGASLVTIDPSRELTLFILLDHPHESYAIDSLSVTVVAATDPEPPTIVVLGNSGWQASWDSSLNPFVDVAVDAVTENAVFIEKTAEFIQGKGPAGFPTIPITFTQIEADAVKQIVINDEVAACLTKRGCVMWRLVTFAVVVVVSALMSPMTASGQHSFGELAIDHGSFPGDAMASEVSASNSGIDSLDGIGEFDWTTTPTTWLWLQDNQISSIESGAFSGLTNLATLRLNDNTALTELNLADADFLSLAQFDVTGNVNVTSV